ncbi:MAG: hypothetical protein IPK07_12275 [Deltaproteobacteria bacterium]|nr:hypothetical protein [Deltaproteobacteria bacterium]
MSARAPREGPGTEQALQERMVRRAAANQQQRVGERAFDAGERLRPVVPPRHDLGEHRVELRRDRITLRDAAVDPEPRPGRHPERRDRTRRHREVARRVLGVEPHLDRVAAHLGRLPGELQAARDLDLELHQVEPGGELRHRVLHLQACVHLEEAHAVGGRIVEELDAADVLIARRGGDPLGHPAQRTVLLLREHGRRRLLDELLVAALDGAVAGPDRPGVAEGVGDELDLDVARAVHGSLQEHRGIAEGHGRLAAHALERGGQLVGSRDETHPASPAADARLEEEREAEPLRVDPRRVQAVHRGATPGHHRDAAALGEAFGLDLVAEKAHGADGRTDEHEPHARAQLRERHLLGDEPPPNPHRLRARLAERVLERGEVEVAALPLPILRIEEARRAEVEALVGLANEARPLIDRRVERHRDETPCGRRPVR